jgi:hypothetical protein
MKYEKGDVCADEDPKYVKERKLLSLLEKVETLDKFDGNEHCCGRTMN